MKNKLIIVAGCSGSGKTTIAGKILNCFNKGQAQVICLDRFYFGRCPKVPFVKQTGQYNFDHPSSLDWKYLYKSLSDLLKNKATQLPCYDYTISKRKEEVEQAKPSKIIILEGTLPLYNKRVRDLAALKIFVDTPIDTCFARRVKRDQKERGRKLDQITKRWKTTVKPMYEKFVVPTKNMADLILPWNDGDNQAGLDLVLTAIRKLVK